MKKSRCKPNELRAPTNVKEKKKNQMSDIKSDRKDQRRVDQRRRSLSWNSITK